MTHDGPLGRQVDARIEDALHLPQGALDPADAGGTGHPLDGQAHLVDRHVVPGLPNDVGEGRRTRRGWVVADGGPLGGEVDARPVDAGGLAEGTLDAAHARGAGHPGDRKRRLLGPVLLGPLRCLAVGRLAAWGR